MNTSDDRRSRAAHQIRLASQWDLEPLPDKATEHGELPGVQRLKHLSDYLQAASAEFQGRFRLVRRFGRPSGLTTTDRVELVGDGLQSATTVFLNDQVLEPLPIASAAEPGDEPILVRFDVSTLLQDRNQLAIEFDVRENPDASGVISDVRLEIFAGDGIVR